MQTEVYSTIMKPFFCLLFILLQLFAQAQSTAGTQTQAAVSAVDTKVSSVNVTPTIASAQTSKWKQQTLLTPSDATAWLNYYNWLDRDRSVTISQKSTALSNTLAAAKTYIAGTWQYNLMQFLQSEKKDSTALFNALKMSTEKNAVYPYVAQFAIINNHPAMLQQYCMAINTALPMTSNMYEYHYNTLMSAAHNAVIYAKGLSDLVPLAILQQVYGVRKDIQLRYYKGLTITTADTYLCISLGKEMLVQYPDAVYTGLLIGLKSSAVELEKNIQDQFTLHYFDKGENFTEEELTIYKNYLPSFILLYKMYRHADSKKAFIWKERIDKLAQKTGTTTMINTLMGD